MDEGSVFSTRYAPLVSRILVIEVLYAFLSEKRHICLQKENEDIAIEILKVKGSYKRMGKTTELVELMHGMSEIECINDG